MKLSINQYNEIFKDRSITNYTKFNWKGDMPVVATYTFTTGFDTKSYASLGLERGKKYIIEVVKREVGQLTGGKTDAGWSCVSFKNQGLTTYTGVEVVDTTDTVQFTDIFCYGNGYNYADSIGQPIKTTIVIKEYVENLVQTFAYSKATEISKTGDSCEFNINDAYGGLSTQLTSSQLAYGDYRWNVNVNYIKSISGTTPLVNFAVYNETKSSYIISNTADRTGIFTLTPANYTPGDTMRFWFLQYTPGDCSIDVGINNYYVCKIQDDWIVRKGNIATWYPNGGQNCFYEIAEKGSRPKYEERTLFFKNNSSSIVTEFYFDNDGNGIVYISEDMPTSDFNEMMSVVDIMYKKA